MKITLDIPDYTGEGLPHSWENGFEITVRHDKNQIVIQANKAGLISLATNLLILAQDEVPIGYHFHYDEYNSLEKDSEELVITKI